jgi:hypothetical protein
MDCGHQRRGVGAFENGPMNEPLTINVNRGLKGMAEGLTRLLPQGQRMLDGGLREILHRAIDQNPEIPKQDFTLVSVAERVGLIEPPRILPEPKPRRRRRV